MAKAMHKILQRTLQRGINPCLKLQHSLKFSPSLLYNQQNLDAVPDPCRISTSLCQEKISTVDNSFHIFPSFSIGLFLNPNFSSGLQQIDSLKAEKSNLDESQILWADSVKKKRKKKMNKHKLRKLRKRIRGYA